MKLSDYIKGLRKGKDAHRLEKDSMKDSFLADAMDGYRQLEGDHTRRLNQLQRQVTTRTSNAKYKRAISWSVAACLTLGLGISSYFLFMKGEDMMPPLAFEEELLSTVVHSPENELAKASVPSHTIDTSRLAQTKHIQPAPISEADMHELIIDDAEEQVATKEEEATVKTEEYVAVSSNQSTGEAMKLARFAAKNIVRGKLVDQQQKEDSQTLNEVVMASYGTENKSLKSVSAPEKEQSNRISEPLIGKSKYNKYLKKNLIRPSDEECKRVKGIVTLTFYIDKDGTPEQFTVVQGLCKSTDQEAIRLVKEGPKWTLSNLPVVLDVKF